MLAETDWDGKGTLDDPYILKSCEDMKLLSERVNSRKEHRDYCEKYYQLGNDIDMDGSQNWVPIGKNDKREFLGSFDGNNKTVSNFDIAASASNAGLFGYLGESAVVKNLTLNGSMDVHNNSDCAGFVTGINFGQIENCIVNVFVKLPAALWKKLLVGAIAGINNGDVIDCKVTAKVTANDPGTVAEEKVCYLGGLCGQNIGKLENCTVNLNTNAVNDSKRDFVLTGGLCGLNSTNAEIVCCEYLTSVSPETVTEVYVYRLIFTNHEKLVDSKRTAQFEKLSTPKTARLVAGEPITVITTQKLKEEL